MPYPAFEIGFKKEEDDWDYGFLTMDLMFAFFLLPEKANNYANGVALWAVYGLQDLANAFLEGKVHLNNKQTYLFLDGTDAIARMLISGDDTLKQRIFATIKPKSERFKTLEEFETYYLMYATQLLNHIRDYCSKDESHLVFYRKLFTRGRDNYTFEEWRRELNISG